MPDLMFEQEAAALGYSCVAGVDEAGRGPLAGPVIAAAVILPMDFSCPFLDDSKKLSKKRRESLYDALSADQRVFYALGIIHSEEIDQINILRATHQAMGLALDSLIPKPDMALIDGLPVKGLSIPHQALVKGDGKSLSIAAASIIAKVTRDRFMAKVCEEFPQYGFSKHQGYGTKVHLEALKKYGPCRYHRRSFQPVSQCALPREGEC